MDWAALFEAHADDVVRICWRILGRHADVEDCVQDTFVQALQLHRRQPVKNWPGLLRRIAVMTSLAMLRRRKTRRCEELSADDRGLASTEQMPDQRAMQRELEDRLRLEVAALPDQEAAVFCLRCFESLSVSETADSLGISAASVSVALHRARRRLEQRMTDVLSIASLERSRR